MIMRQVVGFSGGRWLYNRYGTLKTYKTQSQLLLRTPPLPLRTIVRQLLRDV
jgi:hypothetical protein